MAGLLRILATMYKSLVRDTIHCIDIDVGVVRSQAPYTSVFLKSFCKHHIMRSESSGMQTACLKT